MTFDTFDYGLKERFAVPEGAGSITRADTATVSVSTPSAQDLMAQFDKLALPDADKATFLGELANVPAEQRLDKLAGFMQSINEASTASEASLVQGAQNTSTAIAIGASAGGVGSSAEQAQQAAESFALMAAQAVANGQPLDEVRFSDPTLTEVAKAQIYENVAAQQGTSPEEIAAKREAQQQADMQAVQAAVFGAGGLVAAAEAAEEAPNRAATTLTTGRHTALIDPRDMEKPYGVTASRMAHADLGSDIGAFLEHVENNPPNVPDVRNRGPVRETNIRTL